MSILELTSAPMVATSSYYLMQDLTIAAGTRMNQLKMRWEGSGFTYQPTGKNHKEVKP